MKNIYKNSTDLELMKEALFCIEELYGKDDRLKPGLDKYAGPISNVYRILAYGVNRSNMKVNNP